MAEPHFYTRTFSLVLFLVALLDTIFGCGTYLSLGPNTPERITFQQISKSYALEVVSRVLIVVTFIASHHLIGFPLYDAVDSSRPVHSLKHRNLVAYRIVCVVLRFFLIALTAVPSFTPFQDHFYVYIALVGATFSGFLTFVLPIVLHLRVAWHLVGVFRRIVDVLVLIVTVPLVGIGLYGAVKEALKVF
jgi:hypothetical protein